MQHHELAALCEVRLELVDFRAEEVGLAARRSTRTAASAGIVLLQQDQRSVGKLSDLSSLGDAAVAAPVGSGGVALAVALREVDLGLLPWTP